MSLTVPLYGFGGGGESLNFKIVGDTTEPTNPNENTIWVNTDKKIASWIFSATQPKTATEGMVWITTGATSPVEFNALKKNGIQVYPISAKQYVGGAWVDKTAKSWDGNAWAEWLLYLKPSEREYVTYKRDNGSVSVSGDMISFGYGSNPDNSEWLFAFTEAVDVSSAKKLEATVNVTSTEAALGAVAVTSTLPLTWYNGSNLPGVVAKTAIPNKVGTHEISIPLETVGTSVYVVICGAAHKGAITNIRLE